MKCSEAREKEPAAGTPAGEFRVRVSLARYYSDERARCYMAVAPARPVRSLARRLRRAFALPRPFALLSRGHLLPPDEPLAVLDPDDPVEVIPMKSTEYLVPEINEASGQPSSTPIQSPDDTMQSVADEPDGYLPPHVESIAVSTVSAPAELPEKCSASSNLEDMKRRALELLDEHEASPRRRRRVRRRRRGPAAALAAPEDREPEDPAVEKREPAPEPDRPPVVLRNGAASPRAARLVRPLPAAAASSAAASAAAGLAPPAPASPPPSMRPAQPVTLPAAVVDGRT